MTVEPSVEPVVETEPPVEPQVEPSEEAPKEPTTILNGKDEPVVEDKPYWPDDWRTTLASHAAAGDEKAEKRLMKQLDRYVDPTAIFSKTRELEGKFSEGGLVKVPGKDAKEEDVAAFHKAMGVPEKAEDYFKDIKLDNGAVIGDADKPMADGFAAAVHEAGATPAVVNKAMNWYFNNMEAQAAALDDSDENFHVESTRELKDEWGPAYNRYTNSVSSLFASAPGGTDLDNDGALYGRIMGGRMADGKLIGNDPDMVRWLVGLNQEINPLHTVVDGGDATGKGVDAELKEIMNFRKENKREYFKDEQMQARYRELLDAQAKHRAKA